MSVVQIAEVYPVREIKLASELLYVCELAKAFYINKGYQLSIDGVVLADSLKKSRYWAMFRVALANEWIVNANCDDSVKITEINPLRFKNISNILITEKEAKETKSVQNKRESDPLFDCLTPVPTQVAIVKKDNVWQWNREGYDFKTNSINTNAVTRDISQRLTALVAYVAVERFFSSYDFRFEIVVNTAFAGMQLAFADLTVLQERTNALDEWFSFDYICSVEDQKRIGYEAWWHIGHELGYLDREYSQSDKLAYLDKLNIKEGDVVCLVKRVRGNASDMIKVPSKAYFAIVRKINRAPMGGITFEMLTCLQTRYQREQEFRHMKTAEKAVFNGRFNTQNFRSEGETVEWEDLGIEYAMSSELSFLMPLQHDNFTTLTCKSKKTGKDVNVEMSSVDFVYWLLKDYNVRFAEDRYIARYFKNGTKPVYKRWADGEF